MDDWIRLILLNWVLISFVMFYSILIGLVTGTLLVTVIEGLLRVAGVASPALGVFPFTPAATALVAALIATLFLATFRSLRFNCETGGYISVFSTKSLRRLLRRTGIGVGLLMVSALVLRFIAGGG
jgi:hypothetical protein